MKPLTHKQFSSLGGIARAKSLTKAERVAIAKKGAEAARKIRVQDLGQANGEIKLKRDR